MDIKPTPYPVYLENITEYNLAWKIKLDVDTHLAHLKGQLATAKSNAAVKRTYIDATQFRQLERALTLGSQYSQKLQFLMKELKEKDKLAKQKANDEQTKSDAEWFVKMAKQTLTGNQYMAIWCEVHKILNRMN
jgi:hypothetical protein